MTEQIFGVEDVWAIAEAHNEERPLFIRYRTGLGPLAGDARLSNRLTISWPFEHAADQTGLPEGELSDRMKRFEDAVCATLEGGKLALLTSVWTTSGLREWVWYGGEKSVLARAINEALAGMPRLPLHLAIEPDPAWEQYLGFISSVG